MVDYSETIEFCDIKVSIYSKLNEYIEMYMYQKSRSSLIFVKGHSE